MTTQKSCRHSRARFWLFIIFLFSATLPVYAEAILTIDKKAKRGSQIISSAPTGDPFYYAISFEASSSADSAVNAVITDELSPDLIFLSISGDDKSWIDSYNYDAASHLLTMHLKSPFPTGIKPELFIDVKFKHGVTCPGSVAANQAHISADNATTVSSPVVSVTATTQRPVFSITEVFKVECPIVDIGQQRYEISITLNNGAYTSGAKNDVHIGTENLSGIELRSLLPNGAVLVSASDGGYQSGNEIIWDLGTYEADPVTGKLNAWPLGWESQVYPFCCGGQYGRMLYANIRFPAPPFSSGQTVNNTSRIILTRLCQGDTSRQTSVEHPLCEFNPGGTCSKRFYNLPGWHVAPINAITPFQLGFVNSGNASLDELMIWDKVPAPLRATGINPSTITAGTGVVAPLHAEYKTNQSSASWQAFPGSPYSAGTVNGYYASVPSGYYIDSLRFYTTTPVSPGASYQVSVFAYLMAQDRNGNPVEIGQHIVNGMDGRARAATRELTFHCEDYFNVIPILTPTVMLTKRITSPLPPVYPRQGDQVGFECLFNPQAYGESRGYENLDNPVLADFLPKGVKFISWSKGASAPSVPNPDFQQIDNFHNTGRTLLLWSWTDAAAFSFTEPSQYFRINLTTLLTDTIVNGTNTNGFYLIKTDNPQGFRAYYAGEDRGYEVADSYDLDEDGNTSEKIMYDGADVIVRGSVEYEGSKSTRSNLENNWRQYPNLSYTTRDGYIDCQLYFRNIGRAPILQLEMIDILPFLGDTEVTSSSAKGSAWQPLLTSVNAPAGCTVYYSQQGNPHRPDYGVSGSAPGWSTSAGDLATVKSIKVLWDLTAAPLQPNDSRSLTLRFAARNGAPLGAIAWNSFAFRGYDGVSWYLVTEPNKAGMALAEGNLVKTNLVQSMEAGETYQYRIAYTAPVNLQQATITDTLPSCLYYQSSSPEASMADNVLTWTLNNLLQGQTDTLRVFVRVNENCYQERLDNCAVFITVDRDGRTVTLGRGCDGDRILNLASVGDRAWWDDNMNGLQDEGEKGRAEVTVQLFNEQNLLIASQQSDDNGHYLFTDIEPGKYALHFTPPPEPESALTKSNVADDNLDSDANPETSRTDIFTLTTGQVDLSRDAGYFELGSIGSCIWLDLDQDGLQDADEHGIPGLTVVLLDGNANVLASTKSDKNGNYKFENLRPGAYQVRFQLAEGYSFTAADQGNDDDTDSDANAETGVTKVFNLKMGQDDRSRDAGVIRSGVSTFGEIGYLVWYDENEDGLIGASEQGIADVQLQLLDNQGNELKRDTTDSQGMYRFTMLTAGDYVVTVVTATLPKDYFCTTHNTPMSVKLATGQIFLDANFGYSCRSLQSGTGCSGTVLAWYEPWYADAQNDSAYRSWRVNGAVTHADTSLLGYFDSQNPDIWEHDIMLAWLSGIDGFVVDWYGRHSFENAGLHGLLQASQNLYERLKDKKFDFQIICAYNGLANGRLDANFTYLADSVLTKPAYWGNRQRLRRPLFISDTRPVRLPAAHYRACCDTTLTGDVYLVWNGLDAQDLPFMDTAYPGIAGLTEWDDALGLEWGDAYLDRAYQILSGWQTPRAMLFPIAVAWPGYDDRVWRDSRHHWMDRQDTLVYHATWNKVHSPGHDRFPWVLVESWNDYCRATAIQPAVEYDYKFIVANREHSLRYKSELCWHRPTENLALLWPQHAYQARTAAKLRPEEQSLIESQLQLSWQSFTNNEFLDAVSSADHAAGLAMPDYSASDTPQGIRVSWQAARHATQYRVWYAKEAERFLACAFIKPDHTRIDHTLEILLTNLDAGSTYTIAVCALDPLLGPWANQGWYANSLTGVNLVTVKTSSQISNPDQPDAPAQLVFVAGSPTYPGQGWDNAIDQDEQGWDGTVSTRGDTVGVGPAWQMFSGPAWAIFTLQDGALKTIHGISLRTDNEIREPYVLNRWARKIEIWLSHTDTATTSFYKALDVNRTQGETQAYYFNQAFNAKYIKLVILEPKKTSGCWRQISEFGVIDEAPAGHIQSLQETALAADLRTYELWPNWPNPFNPETQIRFSLPEEGVVSLKVYDLAGKWVATLANGQFSAGPHTCTWNAQTMPSGIYFCRMEAGSFKKTMRMLLLK